MTAIDIDQERESNGSSVSHDQSQESDGKYDKYGESKEKNYEAYRTKKLPEEYTPYNESGQAVELVYDRYGSDYEAEQPGQEAESRTCTPKESCCTKGWLSNLKIRDKGGYTIEYLWLRIASQETGDFTRM